VNLSLALATCVTHKKANNGNSIFFILFNFKNITIIG
jgi:hypothetical protein